MAKVFEQIDDALADWIHKQLVFFVATAPSSGGHVNVSPKGYDTLRVLGPRRVAYRDLTGSGAETAAHLYDDGRITLMWNAFDDPPRIVRVQGQGRYLVAGDAGYDKLDHFLPVEVGARGIVVVDADRISTSCGFAVPRARDLERRDTLEKLERRRGEEETRAYQDRHNTRSIDGLPAIVRNGGASVNNRSDERTPTT